ncbi:MAG: DNA cytosine methyltransferase [bacterium]
MPAINNKKKNRKVGELLTYVSLFSSAGVGCYGFKEESFNCIATVELIERRLKIQEYNHKCIYKSGYIGGDITTEYVKNRILLELEMWKKNLGVSDLDVLIATPPCQGMSVANHKKKDELQRNSLVVESIKLTKRIKPKFFIYENVRAFLSSVCTDIDGTDKPIHQAIDHNLSGEYNIHYQVVNFKDYGNPSSRTRTLVLGVRKDLKDITPLDIFPDMHPEVTLKETIGQLPSLQRMGEIWNEDIYHNFKKYTPHMESWIKDIKEGESAFDNTDISKIPHRVKDGVIIYNARKNGDKYTRQMWNKVAPCIHTRNDIMSSQNTVHPCDNRVFSIREIMKMMSVPHYFKWSELSAKELNSLSTKDKEAYLKREEMNIRQSLGEAVPTIIFRQIAKKIRRILNYKDYTDQEIVGIIDRENLANHQSLLSFIKNSHYYNFATLSKIAELANAKRDDNAAYYTRQDICFAIIKNLPEAKSYTSLRILEPSIGVGNFLPLLINKYKSVTQVTIDVVDIDPFSIEILRSLVDKIPLPNNITINYINADFLLHNFEYKYDIVIGNPPYKKITNDKLLLAKYKKDITNSATNNIFAFFIEKSLQLGDIVSLIVPKSLINTPEFNATRSLMNNCSIVRIIDFGEKAFKGVKIETVSFVINTKNKPTQTVVESYITNNIISHEQSYLTDPTFPYWIIYRNEEFDNVAKAMEFNIFKTYRDRTITKSITKSQGEIRVLKSRNIGNNEIINITDYDCYIDDIANLNVAKFFNRQNCILVPNLTYHPRACTLPSNTIVDGSVAILTPSTESVKITNRDIEFYATEAFSKFYAVARNMGTRSLNIDNNSVFFFGKLKTSTNQNI